LGRVEKLIIACLTAILILSTSYSHDFVFAQIKGPRTEDLIIKFYSNIDYAYQALKDGSIDIIGYELPSNLYQDSINDSNIVLAPVGDRGMYEFDINNNYTCADYPNLESPTHRLEMRQAIAYLTPKNRIVSEFCNGFANRIDQPLAYVQRGWRNQSYWYEDGSYPYEYNSLAAAAALDSGGFLQGNTTNPDYDPLYPGSSEYIRTYPPNHPQKPEQDLDPLVVLIKAHDSRRLLAGRLLDDNLRKLGVPTNRIEWSALMPLPYDEGRFHIYTGGWSLGRFPWFTLFGLYHSSNYGLYQSNYVTGVDQNGDPNYPKLDELLGGAGFLDNHTEAVSAVKNALGYFTEQCITIPLFSARHYWAWSTSLLGVVNSDGVGPVNDYTLMNAYKVDGSPIRIGLKTPPIAMNKIYSSWFYDYQCLERMDLYGGMDVPPYDASVVQTGYILNWNTNTYIDPDDSIEKTIITETYRDDAWFVAPVTGNQLEQVNATHLYASIWYEYQLDDSWNNDVVIDIKTLRVSEPYTLEVYWKDRNFWHIYSNPMSVKSFNWFSKGNLSQTVSESLMADAISGFVSCTEPVFYVLNAESGGTPLVLGTDYDIYMDPDGPYNADVRVINPAYLGAPVNITYLATNDALGYTPGNLPWQDAFEGAGMYYATDFTPGSGGNLTLKRNPFYPTETPVIGEIDFLKKSNGCYKVDIFDVVMAVSAYGSQGISVPDANWFPGVDLAYPRGQIDIFDIVTITSKYGTEWDCP